MSSKKSKNKKEKASKKVAPQAENYKSIDQFWKAELDNNPEPIVNKTGNKETWFKKGNDYWTSMEASNNGVLGGFGILSDPDIKYSLGFLIDLFKQNPHIQRNSVLDCGAGIGRISKQLLTKIFKIIDITDQCDKYVQAAKKNLEQYNKVRNYYCTGLQDFKFQEKYDCVWVQWVLGYLPEKEAIQFFVRAKENLNPNGFIILKENTCKEGFIVDKEDYSVTRSDELFKAIIKSAGLRIIKEGDQTNWPKDLFEVKMYAMQPEEELKV